LRLKLLLQLFIRMLAQLFAEVLLLLQPFLSVTEEVSANTARPVSKSMTINRFINFMRDSCQRKTQLRLRHIR
jgi:hypothetical protein